MKTDTYLTTLRKQYSMNFSPKITEPPDGVAEFLDLTVMRLLLGEDITFLKKWLEEYQRRAPITDRPVAEFFRLTRLAAVEELFGESGQSSAQKARELLPVVSGQPLFETDVALVAQKAVSLSMLLGDGDTAARWREKRLEMPVFEGWEASAFEVLYLSSDFADSDVFDSTVAAVSRVSVNTLSVQAQDSVAPLILSLAAHCLRKNKTLADALNGGILRLEQDVFSDATPKIEISDKRLKYVTVDGKPVLQIAASAKGNGELSTGNYEIAPFTTQLAPTLVKEYKRREKNPVIEETFNSSDGLIECLLKLDKGVKMSESEISNLERRMKVGFEWASHLTKGIKAGIALNAK
ncbi:MAG: hypothetical protein ABWZ66_08315 [Pyrinomonadaceae bacterium]